MRRRRRRARSPAGAIAPRSARTGSLQAARTSGEVRARAARSERAHLPSRGHIGRLEAVVVETPSWSVRASVGDSGAARGGADRAQRAAPCRPSTPRPRVGPGRSVESEIAPSAPRIRRSRSRPPGRRGSIASPELETATPDSTHAEQEAVAGDLRIQPARVLAQRREALVACGEAGAGADRGDVVEVAPEPLELEQERASAADLFRWPQAEDLLGSVRVGDAVGDRAGAAGARGVIDCVAERLPSRRAQGRGVCRRVGRPGTGCGHQRRAAGSGRIRSRPHGSARPRPGRHQGRRPAPSSGELP